MDPHERQARHEVELYIKEFAEDVADQNYIGAECSADGAFDIVEVYGLDMSPAWE